MGMEPVLLPCSAAATPERKLNASAGTPDRKLQQQSSLRTPERKQQQQAVASTPDRKQQAAGTPDKKVQQQAGAYTPDRKQQGIAVTPDRKQQQQGSVGTPDRKQGSARTPDRKQQQAAVGTPERRQQQGSAEIGVGKGPKSKTASPVANSSAPSPPGLRVPSPFIGRRKLGRRTSFKKSGSLKTSSRKDSVEGADGNAAAAATAVAVKDDDNSPVKKKSGSSSSDEEDEGRLKQGPWLLKLAKSYHATGDNPMKAFQFASRALQCFEESADGKSSLDLVVSLHILAALQCRQGHFEEAVGLLERALNIPDPEAGIEHILATFAGQMQLGDTLALQGKHQLALDSYQAALQVQKQALGDLDIRVAETCRYVAEAHLQAMQFDEAEELCELALKIHQEKSEPGSVEEGADRRLMALVCSGKGDHDSALEHLVLASTMLLANGLESDVAAVDASIGDELFALGRDTEAALSYQKALTAFKATKGDGHALVASVLVRLAELYMKTGKPREAKTYCEGALRILGTQGAGHSLEDIVYGLTDVAGIYDLMSEREQAITLLSRAVDIQGSAPGQTYTAAGVEAQLGILYFMAGKFLQSFTALKNSVTKLKSASDGKPTHFLGMLLNQLGLTAVEVCEIDEASSILEESRIVMVDAVGPVHPDTLSVCSNLAGAYDALGRTYEAISLLETVLDIKEDRYGSVHPEVEDERCRLAELLQEVGRSRTRKTNTLEELLSMAKLESSRH